MPNALILYFSWENITQSVSTTLYDTQAHNVFTIDNNCALYMH